MKQYLQHNRTHHIEFRSPKYDLLICSKDPIIFKKEINYEAIS